MTNRLVAEEVVSDSLRFLLEDAQRYMFIINRSTVETETGNTQDASITLSEEDPPSFTNSVDSRLKNSRQVILVLIQEDGGVAKIDLTAGKWEVWIRSETLPRNLRAFNKRLVRGAHSRLFTIEGSLLVAFFPIMTPILAFYIWSFSSKKYRREMWSNPKGLPESKWPKWVLSSLNLGQHLWIIFILIAILLFIITTLSGGLRIWPNYLSRHSLQKGMYELRANFALPQNINSPLFVGVACAVLGAIITYILTR